MPTNKGSFPLPSVDAFGKVLAIGDTVRVLSVESRVQELPVPDRERLFDIVGQSRTIVEFDMFGLAWLGFSSANEPSADFCLQPNELARVTA